jgi:lipoyl-dependent peroxiredoxin subunit D
MTTTSTVNETYASIMTMLDIKDEDVKGGILEVAETNHRYIKDLKLNLGYALECDNLSKKEAIVIALATVANDKNELLLEAFGKMALENETTEAEIAEVFAAVSLMNTNNVLYRFRHFTKKDYYEQTPAKIKMSIMMSPVLGHELFELISLAVSAVNGCEMCVNAHENSLLTKYGSSQARIYDAVRVAAIVKGVSNALY